MNDSKDLYLVVTSGSHGVTISDLTLEEFDNCLSNPERKNLNNILFGFLNVKEQFHVLLFDLGPHLSESVIITSIFILNTKVNPECIVHKLTGFGASCLRLDQELQTFVS